jgi:polysaccharide biosynthesis protein PslH
MADTLQSIGQEVHFLYLQQPLWKSDQSMQQHWQERLHVFRGLAPASFIHRVKRKLLRLSGRTFGLNLSVDSYFDPACARYLDRVLAQHQFDVVIVSYVFYSRLLEFLPDSVLKVIDTHDVFSDRYRLYQEHGQPGEFFSTGRVEEAKALERADAVLAMQEKDQSHFASLTSKPVRVVGHLAPPITDGRSDEPLSGNGILFVGGPMRINVHGVTWFIDHVLPGVRGAVPDAELWLVGGISDQIRGRIPGVRRFGFIDDLGDSYRRAAVVINPQQFGTGLSIKSIEALQYGRPLVTTMSGARGLEEAYGSALLSAQSADEFRDVIIRLLRNPPSRSALGQAAAEFARRYYQRNVESLAELVNSAISGRSL